MEPNAKTFTVTQIGTIQRAGDAITVQIDEAYRPALKGLETFSHVYVYWWAANFDEAMYRELLVTELPYADNIEAGMFACRSPIRPNLIMNTVCKILDVDEAAGTVRIQNIDAFDGTPVLDLKPYYPVTDRVKDATISDYLVGWPEWVPEEGSGLMEHELEQA
jgi:tRNA-Thr(GGU) m(6)t(6)A37 methyltransferase TsaA